MKNPLFVARLCRATKNRFACREVIHELPLRCLVYGVNYEMIMKRLNNAHK
jgi:hypothetical protein